MPRWVLLIKRDFPQKFHFNLVCAARARRGAWQLLSSAGVVPYKLRERRVFKRYHVTGSDILHNLVFLFVLGCFGVVQGFVTDTAAGGNCL